jgi:AhpD family alkylhydroperoxidase
MGKLKRHCMGVAFVSVLLMPAAASAQDADAAYAEMKDMFGGVPSIMQVYPKSAVPAGWAMIKETDLNENTALSPKYRELIGLGVAAQIPCHYCIYYHTKAAKVFGASEEEVREAVHMSSLVRHWSTVLQGNQYDLDAFKAETDAAFSGMEGAPSAEEAITELNHQWVQAFKDRDFDKIGSLMADDAMLLPQGAPAVLGRSAVVEMWKSWGELANVAVDFAADKLVVAQSGELAYDYGHYSFAFDSDEGRVSDEGKYIVIWTNVGGEWRIAADIYNSNAQ